MASRRSCALELRSIMKAIFFVYVALSGYNAGVLWAMQLMHYPLYALVGDAEFARYITANNRSAIVAAVVPSVLSIITAALLCWRRPAAVPFFAALVALMLALGVLVSSLIWQAGIHVALARDGKSLALIARLVATNWVRTLLDTLQLGTALWMLSRIIP
jgi:hypothetical protein